MSPAYVMSNWFYLSDTYGGLGRILKTSYDRR